MTNKEIYKALCERENLPLFMQYWWLEGVSAGHDWDVLLVTEQAETPAPEAGTGYSEEPLPKVLAAMPYEITRRWWMRYINQPVLCPYGGIWFAPELEDNAERIDDMCRQLDSQLQALKVRAYGQHFLPGSPAAKSLEQLGYKFSNRRTYILEDVQDLDKVIAGFSRNKRNKLQKNTVTYNVENIDAEEFFQFHHLTVLQKKQKLQYNRETLLVMAEKAAEKGCIRIFGVKSADHELLAAAVVVWDDRSVYQLINTFDHDHPDCGARELLTLEAIKQARELGLKLDFTYHRDYLKHYGAKRAGYFVIQHGSSFHMLLQRFDAWKKRY